MAMPAPDRKPVEPKRMDQVDATRGLMRASMKVMPLGEMALAAIEAGDSAIDRQTRRK